MERQRDRKYVQAGGVSPNPLADAYPVGAVFLADSAADYSAFRGGEWEAIGEIVTSAPATVYAWRRTA